jgi:hypothetical protein
MSTSDVIKRNVQKTSTSNDAVIEIDYKVVDKEFTDKVIENNEKTELLEFTDKLYKISIVMAVVLSISLLIYGLIFREYFMEHKTERTILIVIDMVLIVFTSIMYTISKYKTARLMLIIIQFFIVGATCGFSIHNHI